MENTNKTNNNSGMKGNVKIREMAYIALFAVLMCVSSWISVPGPVPFTLQTFGVFCALGMLGGRRGTLAVLVYILLGAFGLPVFSGFNGGLGALLGTTGGYIIGFVISALVYWLVIRLLGQKRWTVILGMLLGLLVCYAFGTAWFMYVYAKQSGAIGLGTALGWCVFPFIVPDVLKIALAVFLSEKLSQHIKL